MLSLIYQCISMKVHESAYQSKLRKCELNTSLNYFFVVWSQWIMNFARFPKPSFGSEKARNWHREGYFHAAQPRMPYSICRGDLPTVDLSLPKVLLFNWHYNFLKLCWHITALQCVTAISDINHIERPWLPDAIITFQNGANGNFLRPPKKKRPQLAFERKNENSGPGKSCMKLAGQVTTVHF